MSFRLTNRALAATLKQVSRTSFQQGAVKTIASAVFASSKSARLFSSNSKVSNKFISQVSNSIQNEIEHEVENEEAFPEELDAFLDSSSFEIAKTDGSSLAKIVKSTDSEIINVFFDINQVANINPSAAAEEEGLDQDEAQEAFDEDIDNSFINLNVVIEKKADGSAIAFDLLVGPEDGANFIERVTTYENASEALLETSEAEHSRELTYSGPAFSNLDESLQVNLESYLVSRGINEELYQFVLNYGLYKENVEYVRWLNKLNKYFTK